MTDTPDQEAQRRQGEHAKNAAGPAKPTEAQAHKHPAPEQTQAVAAKAQESGKGQAKQPPEPQRPPTTGAQAAAQQKPAAGNTAAKPMSPQPATPQPAKAQAGTAQQQKAQPGPAPNQKPAPKPQQPTVTVLPTAPPAAPKRRHWGVLFSFFLLVIAPLAVTIWYLYTRAADQYASTVGFTVRTEETSSAIGMLGEITGLSRTSGSDTDVLYEFIQSQELVQTVDEQLDLRTIYTRPENDPVFSLQDDASIEDLVSYWERMVRIFYDAGTGLIEVRVHAFEPEEAQAVAQAILAESDLMINDLSAIARDDATRYAREELERAVERLRTARQAVTEFRSRTQIVDPTADLQGQLGVLFSLQQQLAQALVELDLLVETSSPSDPRVLQEQRRIAAIEARIADERSRFGIGGQGPGGEDYSTLVGEFERLTVDREFAEQAYLTALAAYDAALAEAQRQSRYLAAYIQPTLAETPQYPQREIFALVAGLFLFMSWSIGVLIYYSIKDRR